MNDGGVWVTDKLPTNYPFASFAQGGDHSHTRYIK